MKNTLAKISGALLPFALPLMAYAQPLPPGTTPPTNVDATLPEGNAFDNVGALAKFVEWLIQVAIPIVVGIAVLYFLYTVLKFMFSDDKKESQPKMIHALIGLFIVFAFWGLIAFLGNSTGLIGTSQIPLPKYDAFVN